MIGVCCTSAEEKNAAELFQLFKTPWERYVAGRQYDIVLTTVDLPEKISARLLLIFGAEPGRWDKSVNVSATGQRSQGKLKVGDRVLPLYGKALTFGPSNLPGPVCAAIDGEIAGFKCASSGQTVLRLGFNLFQEIEHLFSKGQPREHATTPTLDYHVCLLRDWIRSAGVPFAEIRPVPAGRNFHVCLTHDIDFIGIRQHFLDHSMWGFVLRATVGATGRFLRGRMSVGRLFQCWFAVATLPLVYLGWKKDFWIPFDWFLEVQKGLPATFYFIPFKRRAGEKVPGKNPERRATQYDITDIPDWIARLRAAGCEIGVHGIDSWQDVEKGRAELQQVRKMTGDPAIGIRMHWLMSDGDTVAKLEQAGYDYDATVGYNETPGFRAGTAQVYCPPGAHHLLELPLHIQDGALFYPRRLDLSDSDAWAMCSELIKHIQDSGGVLSLLWHDRSHGPERFWGDFYIRLINHLKTTGATFVSARDAVEWYRQRRTIVFSRISGDGSRETVLAENPTDTSTGQGFVVRVHGAQTHNDVVWSGNNRLNITDLLANVRD